MSVRLQLCDQLRPVVSGAASSDAAQQKAATSGSAGAASSDNAQRRAPTVQFGGASSGEEGCNQRRPPMARCNHVIRSCNQPCPFSDRATSVHVEAATGVFGELQG